MRLFGQRDVGKYRFGKKAVKFDVKNLKMTKYMVNVPDPPVEFDNLEIAFRKLKNTNISTLFPMDGNNKYGNCVVAGMAHLVTAFHSRIGELQIPPEQDVIKFYKKLSGCRDRGLVMLDTLKYWRKNDFYGHKILAFGQVNLKSHKNVKQCIHLFGGVDLGFQVQDDAIKDFDNNVAYNNNVVWTPGPSSGGGHCVVAVSYDEYTVGVLTWGGFIRGTWDWWDTMVDEAYALLPPEAANLNYTEGFDFDQLQADLVAVTTS
jgi:hypothetical protein